MKAIAISGSPRKNGNTEKLLDYGLKVLEKEGIETELVPLQGKDIKPCTGCLGCRKNSDKRCVLKDNDFEKIFRKMLNADIIIVGSPVYFGSATSQLTALLDRAGYVSRGRGNLFSRKLGGPVVVARRAGQNFTFAQLISWYIINDMIVPGSSYWSIGFGGAKGEIEEDSEAIASVQRFAENLAWLAHKITK
ncbi:MAG: flavodoxin family protein [Victivallales bacterium]|nr:flavodoxin family protein [Victivallales bacterium]MCF7888519.1 flavodoxin family protein [Victivallales bacterium]